MFLDKKSKNTTTTKLNIKHKNPCRSQDLNLGPLVPKANALPLLSLSQLRVTIVVKLVNCFDAMG